MNEPVYVRDANGNYIEDRRTTNMDLQQTMLKLVAKFESLEENIDVKLDGIKTKISNLEERVFNNFESKDQKITSLESLIGDHLDDDVEKEVVISSISSYKEKFEEVLHRVKTLEEKVSKLENASIVGKARLVDELANTIKVVIFGALAAGLLGFVIWAVTGYLRQI